MPARCKGQTMSTTFTQTSNLRKTWRQWLRAWLFPGAAARRRPTRYAARPRVEVLEDRIAPAVPSLFNPAPATAAALVSQGLAQQPERSQAAAPQAVAMGL